ncbi:ParB N-terminal domain-containing protein [Pendulispora brunnea]|uniref:ParB N-terminal domain-containing protein n=1 Tax=Pendulispora brunnea TaxID=2905690 RepID=A0ABZ2KCE0_9BACT
MMDLYALPEHPAARLFPIVGEAELRRLAEDIKANGLRNPVIVLEVMGERWLLDGRSRLRACQLAGVEPTHRVWVGSDPIGYVTSVNLHRRHLDATQRGLLAVELVRLYEDEAKIRRGGRPKGQTKPPANLPEVSRDRDQDRDQRESRAKAAAQVGVSPRTVQNARKVLAKGAPEVVAAAQAGKVALGDAVQILNQPADVQAAIVAKVEAGESKTLTAALLEVTHEDDLGYAAEIEPEVHAEAVEAIWAAIVALPRDQISRLHERLQTHLQGLIDMDGAS